MDRKSNLNIVKDFKKKIMRKIPVKKIVFFGSRAWGKPKRWSDFDLIIVSDKFNNIKSIQRSNELYNYWKVDYPVDFICLTSGEFNKLKKGITIVSEALKKGIVLS